MREEREKTCLQLLAVTTVNIAYLLLGIGRQWGDREWNQSPTLDNGTSQTASFDTSSFLVFFFLIQSFLSFNFSFLSLLSLYLSFLSLLPLLNKSFEKVKLTNPRIQTQHQHHHKVVSVRV